MAQADAFTVHAYKTSSIYRCGFLYGKSNEATHYLFMCKQAQQFKERCTSFSMDSCFFNYYLDNIYYSFKN